MKKLLAILAMLSAAAACSPAAQDEAPMPIEGGQQAGQAPADVLAVIQAGDAGFIPTEAIQDNTTGAQGYEVTGTNTSGEVTYHLMHFNEGWAIVQIRRNVAWGDAPQVVRDVVATAPQAFVPKRVTMVHEQGGAGEGVVMYELYAAGGAEPPQLTVRVTEDGAAIMPPVH